MSIYKASVRSLLAKAAAAERRADRAEWLTPAVAWRREAERLRLQADVIRKQEG